MAEEIAAKGFAPGLANAIVGGVLVTLLSFLLQAVDRVLSRMVVAYLVGLVLAVGPFAHVVVTALHLLFGAMVGAPVGFDDMAANEAHRLINPDLCPAAGALRARPADLRHPVQM